MLYQHWTGLLVRCEDFGMIRYRCSSEFLNPTCKYSLELNQYGKPDILTVRESSPSIYIGLHQ